MRTTGNVLYLTNASLRGHFGVEEKNKAAVSRYIREAVDAGVTAPSIVKNETEAGDDHKEDSVRSWSGRQCP